MEKKISFFLFWHAQKVTGPCSKSRKIGKKEERYLQNPSPGLFCFNFRASIGSCPSFFLSNNLLAKLFQS